MKGKKRYELLLLITFIAMSALCAVLNLTGRQRVSVSNIAINAVMFLIVGIVFLNCWKNCFRPMSEIIEDLDEAAVKIRRETL